MSSTVGHAAVGNREWLIHYNIGDVVYHVIETDKRPGIVTQICLQDGRVTYAVEFGYNSSNWYQATVLTPEYNPQYV